jgi:serine/threonine protein kinase
MDDPLIGRQLANYRIERLIGRGGMASVYYAFDVRLNRPAAVKVIDAHLRAKEVYTIRFVQEARAVATWRHENIVQIYYAGDEDGLYYFAMEYIDGTTLAQILADQAAAGQLLPTADVLGYGRAIAKALDYAHRKGVIHRDVKPLNVMVASDGRVVLTDFGLVLDTTQGSLGEVFGSAHYAAPEQARRSNAALPQSDLYSLGVILYEMLTGTLPFDDPSPTSVALQHITLPPPSPCQINPGLSEAVETVLLRSLAKNPAERYPTGAALIDALETALQEPSIVDLPKRPISADTLGEQHDALTPLPPIPDATGAQMDIALPPATGPLITSKFHSKGWLLGISVAGLCLVFSVVTAIAATNLKGILTAQNPTQTLQIGDIPVVSPSAGPTLTNLPTASKVPVITLSPSITPTNPPVSTLTKIPVTLLPATSSPQPISEVIPPLSTSQPVPTSTPQKPTATLKYTDRRRFLIFYNETSFYMLQLSGVGDLIGGVAFERLDANGQPLNRFSGSRWAKYSPSSALNWCFRLEISGLGNYLRPPACEEKYMATLHPEPGDPTIFWTPQEGSTVFRVLWHDEELVRCSIAAGTCEVYLP